MNVELPDTFSSELKHLLEALLQVRNLPCSPVSDVVHRTICRENCIFGFDPGLTLGRKLPYSDPMRLNIRFDRVRIESTVVWIWAGTLMHVPLARRGAETRTTENKNPENKVTVIHKINYKVTEYSCTFFFIKL
jgi:hypothetical protein